MIIKDTTNTTNRTFLEKVKGWLRAIPFIKELLPETTAAEKPTAGLFDNKSFNDILVEKFNEPHPNLLFLDRTKVVNCADDVEVLGNNSVLYTSDLISSDDAVIPDENSKFTYSANSIPNIKIGQRISDSIISRQARLRNEINKTNTVKILNDYRETLAENLVIGMKQRMNLQIVDIMLGGSSDVAGGIKMKVDTPEGVHTTVDWSKPFTAIRAHVDFMAENYGELPNRMTLGSPAYKRLLQSTEFQDAYTKYRKENAARFEEFINLYRENNNNVEPSEAQLLMHFAPTVINKETSVFIELYDATFRIRKDNGTSESKRVLPENKVVFSNSNSDGDGHSIDYAQGIVVETIVATVIEGSPDLGGEKFGPVGYFTGNTELNPPDIKAWAVNRGLPRLHNTVAFSSFTI